VYFTIYKKLFFSVIILASSCIVSAQDIHFSQFYASPMNLNPALAGVIDGDFRIAAIYRNQWASVSTPYITAGGSFDLRIPIEKLKKDILAAGINVVNNKSGDGKLGMMNVSLSAAYHKRLDKNGNHFLGLALQPGFVQRKLSPNDLLFPNQYNGSILDPSRPNGENFASNNINYFDMNTGLLYSGKLSKRFGLMQGISMYHLTKPKETFNNDNSARLQNRFTVHGGLRIKIVDWIYLTPNYIFQYQNKAMETNFGSAVEFHVKGKKENVILNVGGWYRLNDAAIASAGVEYKKLRMGVSYDFNTSSLQPATNKRGGFELTLIYTGIFVKQDVGPMLVPCPRL
jgi:type IX secretion system PorP/SprF family membrane protein